MASWTQAENQAWLDEIHKSMDSFDYTRIPEFYASDTVLRVGQQPERVGLEATLESMKPAGELCESVKHINVRLDVIGDLLYHTMLMEFVLKADPKKEVFPINCLTVTERVPKGQKEEGKVKRQEVYMDFSPVMDRIKALGLM